VITQFSVEDEGYLARAREVFIRMSLLALMGVSCFVLLRPFLTFLISGIIIAIASYPGYRMLMKVLGGRKNLAAVLGTVLVLLLVIVPSVLLAGTLADGLRTLAHNAETGLFKIPPAPANIQKLPIIGSRLQEFWNSCSSDLAGAMSRLAPQVQKYIPALLSMSAGIGGALLQFLISIMFAGFLLANSEGNARFADRVFARIFESQGPEFKELVAATIRSVTNGILGVALIQSLFAGLGFWFVGLPGAGLWAAIFLVLAVLQVGQLLLVPAVLFVFATHPTTHAVMFLIWCIIVAGMDNVLKPILLGRGSKVPLAVIFLGVLGGFMTMRLLGLFVGAIVLSVGYKLFLAWLATGTPSRVASPVSAKAS
jgi:predicted PurR-regulated permease PerM